MFGDYWEGGRKDSALRSVEWMSGNGGNEGLSGLQGEDPLGEVHRLELVVVPSRQISLWPLAMQDLGEGLESQEQEYA